MKNSVLLKDLSESKIDQIVDVSDLKAGHTRLTFCWGESWWHTFTNGDDSSKTGGNCC